MYVQIKLVGHSCSGMQLLILEKTKQVEEVLLLKTSIMWVRYWGLKTLTQHTEISSNIHRSYFTSVYMSEW
jgi:hypothetical protein